MKKFKTESKRILDLMINSIYTNKEIFLRELLSNCSDAIDKLYYKSLTDNLSDLTRGDFKIDLKLDKKARTITITDNGIGMTAEELENNLGTIAKSGSLDFKADDKLKEEDINIIGQFGVGFYSAFMVAKKVEVISKAYGADEANKWVSEGADGFEITPCKKEGFGTTIILYIKDNEGEESYDTYLEEYTVKSLVKKYSDYIRYPIKMEVTKYKEPKKEGGKREEYKEEETLNSMIPLWKKNKSEVTKEEYESFYKDTFYDSDAPLKTIHTQVEGAVSFKALMYIPEKAPYNYYSKQFEKGLKLYTNGVMIMDKCADLLPDYFSFVRGVVDSELDLNISREVVQQSRQLKAIANNIEKKIKSELASMLTGDRENYEKFFDAFGLQLKYGIYSSWGMNKDALQDLILFRSVKLDKLVTFKEYVDNLAEGQDAIYYATAKSLEGVKSLPQVDALLDKGYDVLAFVDDVDEFVIKFIGEYDKKQFKNVASESLGGEEVTLNDTEKEIFEFMKTHLEGKVVKVKASKSLKDHPVCLSAEGEVSLEMENVLNAVPGADGSVKANKVLEINYDHAILDKIKVLYESDKDSLNVLTDILYNQALLISGLKIENPTKLTDDIVNLLAK